MSSSTPARTPEPEDRYATVTRTVVVGRWLDRGDHTARAGRRLRRWLTFSHSVGATPVGTVYQSVNAVPNVIFEIAAGGVLAAVAVPLVAGGTGACRRPDRRRDGLGAADLGAGGAAPTRCHRPPRRPADRLGPARHRSAGGGRTRRRPPGHLRHPATPLRCRHRPRGILQAHRRFVAAAVAPLLSSLVVIATYLTYGSLVSDPSAEIVAIAPWGGPRPRGGHEPRRGRDGAAPGRPHPSGRRPTPAAAALPDPVAAGPIPRARWPARRGRSTARHPRRHPARQRPGRRRHPERRTYAQAVALLPYAVLAVPLATAAFPSLAGARPWRTGTARTPRCGARSASAATSSAQPGSGSSLLVPSGPPCSSPSPPRGHLLRACSTRAMRRRVRRDARCDGRVPGRVRAQRAGADGHRPARAEPATSAARRSAGGAVVGLGLARRRRSRRLLVLDPDRADGPATLRILALRLERRPRERRGVALTWLVARV